MIESRGALHRRQETPSALTKAPGLGQDQIMPAPAGLAISRHSIVGKGHLSFRTDRFVSRRMARTSRHECAANRRERRAMICEVGTCQRRLQTRNARARSWARLDNRVLGALPFATGTISRLAYAHASRTGIELTPLLRKAGLTYRQLDDRTVRFPVQRQIRFLNLVADALGDDFLGFHLARSPDLRELGILYYVAASSETLREALHRLARYTGVVNEGLSMSYCDRKDLAVAVKYVGVARHLDCHQMECSLTFLLRLCRKLTGLRLVPCRVSLTHHRNRNCGEIEAFFGVDVQFGQEMDEIAFAPTAKDAPLVSADRYLNELLVGNCEEALSRRPRNYGAFRSAVENALAPLLPHGKGNAGHMAERLGVSRRTFTRRLAAEGVSFTELLGDLRLELARHYLTDETLSISRIAWLLGYQEVSAFTHAFKRRTGTPPREARLTRPVTGSSAQG